MKHIIKNANYDNYNKIDVCNGIGNDTNYSVCTNQSMNHSWFCKIHNNQHKRKNLEFVNFIRENQGLPCFMDWAPIKEKPIKQTYNTYAGLLNWNFK
jgi:hypothetical protein